MPNPIEQEKIDVFTQALSQALEKILGGGEQAKQDAPAELPRPVGKAAPEQAGKTGADRRSSRKTSSRRSDAQ